MGFRGHQIDWIPGFPGFGLGIPGTLNSSKMSMLVPGSAPVSLNFKIFVKINGFIVNEIEKR